MDINMPVMDGHKATSILKARMRQHELPPMPIVALTAARCEDPAERQRFLTAGFDEVGTSRANIIV